MKKKKSERIKEEKRKKLGCFIFVAVEFLFLVFMLCRREYEDYRLENYGIPLKAVVLKVENFHFGRSANCPGFGYQYRYNGIYYMTGILTICLVKKLRLVIRLI